MMNYKTQGVCSRAIHFDVVDNKLIDSLFGNVFKLKS